MASSPSLLSSPTATSSSASTSSPSSPSAPSPLAPGSFSINSLSDLVRYLPQFFAEVLDPLPPPCESHPLSLRDRCSDKEVCGRLVPAGVPSLDPRPFSPPSPTDDPVGVLSHLVDCLSALALSSRFGPFFADRVDVDRICALCRDFLSSPPPFPAPLVAPVANAKLPPCPPNVGGRNVAGPIDPKITNLLAVHSAVQRVLDILAVREGTVASGTASPPPPPPLTPFAQSFFKSADEEKEKRLKVANDIREAKREKTEERKKAAKLMKEAKMAREEANRKNAEEEREAKKAKVLAKVHGKREKKKARAEKKKDDRKRNKELQEKRLKDAATWEVEMKAGDEEQVGAEIMADPEEQTAIERRRRRAAHKRCVRAAVLKRRRLTAERDRIEGERKEKEKRKDLREVREKIHRNAKDTSIDVKDFEKMGFTLHVTGVSASLEMLNQYKACHKTKVEKVKKLQERLIFFEKKCESLQDSDKKENKFAQLKILKTVQALAIITELLEHFVHLWELHREASELISLPTAKQHRRPSDMVELRKRCNKLPAQLKKTDVYVALQKTLTQVESTCQLISLPTAKERRRPFDMVLLSKRCSGCSGCKTLPAQLKKTDAYVALEKTLTQVEATCQFYTGEVADLKTNSGAPAFTSHARVFFLRRGSRLFSFAFLVFFFLCLFPCGVSAMDSTKAGIASMAVRVGIAGLSVGGLLLQSNNTSTSKNHDDMGVREGETESKRQRSQSADVTGSSEKVAKLPHTEGGAQSFDAGSVNFGDNEEDGSEEVAEVPEDVALFDETKRQRSQSADATGSLNKVAKLPHTEGGAQSSDSGSANEHNEEDGVDEDGKKPQDFASFDEFDEQERPVNFDLPEPFGIDSEPLADAMASTNTKDLIASVNVQANKLRVTEIEAKEEGAEDAGATSSTNSGKDGGGDADYLKCIELLNESKDLKWFKLDGNSDPHIPVVIKNSKDDKLYFSSMEQAALMYNAICEQSGHLDTKRSDPKAKGKHGTKRENGFASYCHNACFKDGGLCGHVFSIAKEKTRALDVCCLSTGKTIRPSDVAYVVTENTSHAAQCSLPKPELCLNCLQCAASPNDTVLGKDGKSTVHPYSSCTSPCANCASTEHTVYDCPVALNAQLLSRGKACSRPATAYTAVQLATIAFKYYKARNIHSTVQANLDSGLHLRAVLLNYVKYPMVKENGTALERLQHVKKTHNFTALVYRVQKIVDKLFASGVGAIEEAEQNVTHGVNYLRELGDFYVERDRIEGKEWPVGQRSTFDLITKSAEEMATILVHAAMLKYYRYGVWLFGTAAYKKLNSLVANYDKSIRNDVTYRNGELHFLGFDAKSRNTLPQSKIDEIDFERSEEERRALAIDQKKSYARQTFVGSRSLNGRKSKLDAWCAAGNSVTDYDKSFRVARTETGSWSAPASKRIASKLAEHPLDKRYFHSYKFCSGPALRLFQNSPPFVTQDAAHIQCRAFKGGVVISSHFFDAAKNRHMLGEMYCIEGETKNCVIEFNEFLQASFLPRHLYNDPDAVFCIDQGTSLITAFEKVSSNLPGLPATPIMFDYYHQKNQFKGDNSTPFYEMSKTSSKAKIDKYYELLTPAGKLKLDLKGGGKQGRGAYINRPATIRNCMSNAPQEGAQNKQMTERRQPQVHLAFMDSVNRGEDLYERRHTEAVTSLVSQPSRALVPCSEDEWKVVDAKVKSERCLGWKIDFLASGQHGLSVHNKTHSVVTPAGTFLTCLSVPARIQTKQQRDAVTKVQNICDDVYNAPTCDCGAFHVDWCPCEHIIYLKKKTEEYVNSEEFKRRNASYVIPLYILDHRCYFTANCRVRNLRFAYATAGNPIKEAFTMEACVANAAKHGRTIVMDNLAVVIERPSAGRPPDFKRRIAGEAPRNSKTTTKEIRVQPQERKQKPYWDGGLFIRNIHQLLKSALPSWSYSIGDDEGDESVILFQTRLPLPGVTKRGEQEFMRHLSVHDLDSYDKMLDSYRDALDRKEFEVATEDVKGKVADKDEHYILRFTEDVSMRMKTVRFAATTIASTTDQHKSDLLTLGYPDYKFRSGSELLLYSRQEDRTSYNHLFLNQTVSMVPKKELTPDFLMRKMGHVQVQRNANFPDLDVGAPRCVLKFEKLTADDEGIYKTLESSTTPLTFRVGGEEFNRAKIEACISDKYLPDPYINAFTSTLRRRLRQAREARGIENMKPMIVLSSLFMPKLMCESEGKGVYSYDALYSNSERFFGEAYLREELGSTNIFEAAAMYIPFNIPHHHWTGAIAHFSTKKLVYLDSQRGEPCYRVYAVLQFLSDHWGRLKERGVLPSDSEDFDVTKWTIEVPVIADGAHQDDKINCLVFQCAYLEQICEGRRSLQIAPGTIANGRKSLLVELYKARNDT